MTAACPTCSSKAFKRNGYTRHGKQNHRCLDCGRQFSLDPESTLIFESFQSIDQTFANSNWDQSQKTNI